jgi:peptidoglycan hydrolase-like amidase
VSSETPEAYAAVLDTAELVVTGADGEIFETMYASTDAVVDRFHGGKSMSQTGAALKADEGWNFVEILAFYYRDTTLAGL